jgi:hypothetical protein
MMLRNNSFHSLLRKKIKVDLPQKTGSNPKGISMKQGKSLIKSGI